MPEGKTVIAGHSEGNLEAISIDEGTSAWKASSPSAVCFASLEMV